MFLICSLFLQQKCYSEEGRIKYEAAISFFPHVSEDDFAVSYDAYFSKVVFEAPGRRSKKREQGLMESLRQKPTHWPRKPMERYFGTNLS